MLAPHVRSRRPQRTSLWRYECAAYGCRSASPRSCCSGPHPGTRCRDPRDELPVCDHVDVAGHGLEPNATLTLVIRDVRTGQEVLPAAQVTTDGSGSFEREFDLVLARHPVLLADLYERNGTTLVLAAHTGAQAPAHCKRATSLPYTGAGTTSAGMVAGGLLAAGGLLLLATRRRRHGPSSARS